MNRNGFLSSAVAAAAAAVPGGTHLVERQADFDEKNFASVVGRAARIRQAFQAVAFKPGVLSNIKNSFNGLQFGYGYPADSLAIAFAPHGPSAAFGYSDYVWKKYGIGRYHDLKDASGAPILTNTFLAKKAPVNTAADPDDGMGMYQDASIEMLQARGLIFLMCHTAIEEQSRGILKRGLAPPGASASDVADDILTHVIPGAIVVPSMVATLAVLQAEYHYTYLTIS